MEKGFTCRPDICAIDANLPPTTQIKNIFCDSLVHDERALKFLVEVVGEVSIARMRSAAPPPFWWSFHSARSTFAVATEKKLEKTQLPETAWNKTRLELRLLCFQDNVVLGSDYPFPLGESHPGKLIDNSSLLGAEVKVRPPLQFFRWRTNRVPMSSLS